MGERDIANMQYVLKLKFDSHPDIKAKLLLTGYHTIIEEIGTRNGKRIFFWGMKKVNGNWEDHNMMGNLLMQLRAIYTVI